MQNIGNMDIDQTIDVPDTPDRLASRQIGRVVFNKSENNTLVACDSGKSKLTLRGRNRLISENGSHRGLHFSSQKNLNNPEATEQPSMQNIGNMDIDQTIDVPDTPDRLASRQIGRVVFNKSENNTLVACDSGKSKLTLRGRNRLISENGSHRGLHFSSQKNLNNPEATEQPSMQNIGNMDIDQTIDVPDTPDRLASRQIGRVVFNKSENNTLVACDSGKSKLTLRGRNRLISENGSHRGLHFSSQKNLNNPEATEQRNNIFRSSEGSCVSRNNHIYRRVIESGIPKNEKLIDKGKLSCDISRANTPFEECKIELDSMKQNSKLGNTLNPFLLAADFKEGPTETNGSLHRRQNSLNMNNIYCKGKEKASEGIDLTGDTPPKIGKFVTPSVHHIASPRVTGQKRLVRNGCISPLNIAKMKQSIEQKQVTCGSKEVGNTNTRNLVSRNSPCTIDITDSSAEGSNCARLKGKGLLHSSTAREVVAKTRHMTGSSSTRHNQDANGTNSGNENTSEIIEESFGWRSTGNRSRKMHLPLHDEDTNLPRTKAANSFIKRQKNHGSTSSNHGKGTKSRSDYSEIMMVDSSLEPSNSHPTRNWSGRRRSVLDPVIEVDELLPELGPQNINSASEARVRQLEADEILALELQQQFYQETPIQGGRENIDEHIAWTLHQEEAAEQASSSGRHDILNPRASSISSMHSVTELVLEEDRNYRQPRSRALPNYSNRRRLHSRASTSARMTQLRNLHNQAPSMLARGRHIFPPDMDLDMRIDILEALESMDSDFGDMRMGNHMLQVNRDFNENDYEMLLALDENNDQHGGARIDQINRLPQSTVQTEILEEACSICLENPTMGETIRHLPCLHKFHKDCIDPWLSRKRSCPVCKSSIT